jgi:hypothetical protein
VTLVTPVSMNTPYTSLLIVNYANTLRSVTYQTIDVTIDRTQSIVVQIRDTNTSVPRDCLNQTTFYSCPFSFTNETSSEIQLT